MSSDPRSLAHEVGTGTGLRSYATGGRLENTPFYLPLEADWRTLYSTCHWRQTGEHSVLPATGGRLENTPFYLPLEQTGEHSVLPATGGRLEKTPFYLPLEADWRRLRSTCHWRQTGEHSVLTVINRKRDSSTCIYDCHPLDIASWPLWPCTNFLEIEVA